MKIKYLKDGIEFKNKFYKINPNEIKTIEDFIIIYKLKQDKIEELLIAKAENIKNLKEN